MLYRIKTGNIDGLASIRDRVWSMGAPGSTAIIDLPPEMLADKEVRLAIRTGVLVPVSERRSLRAPWCPRNGDHGAGRGPSGENVLCRLCATTLSGVDQFCPSCFACRTCERTIKRKYKG